MLRRPQPQSSCVVILSRLEQHADPDIELQTHPDFDLQCFLECPTDATTTVHMMMGIELVRDQLAQNPQRLLQQFTDSPFSSTFLVSNLCDHMKKKNRLNELEIFFSEPYFHEFLNVAVHNSFDLNRFTQNFPKFTPHIMQSILNTPKLKQILQAENSPEDTLMRLKSKYVDYADQLTIAYANIFKPEDKMESIRRMRN